MTPTTRQLPSNPALDFAQSILDVTNNGLELIEILRDIAEDRDNANTSDRITAVDTLMDRAFGKRPRRLFPNTDPAPDTGCGNVGAPREAPPLGESPSSASSSGPESPRLVTRIGNALNESIGSAPVASRLPAQPADSTESSRPSDPSDPNSIHFAIQQHILDITNNGQTLRDILLEIARARPEPVEGAEGSARITPYHRRRATGILIDRALGADPTRVLSAAGERSEPGKSVSHHPDYPPGYVLDPTKSCIYCSSSLGMKEGHEGEHRRDPKLLAEARAEIQRLKDEGILTPDPNRPLIDISSYRAPKDWVPHPDEVRKEAAKFRAEIELRYERQQQWPAIEERRRKKLKQVYPSHSEDDGEPPDT